MKSRLLALSILAVGVSIALSSPPGIAVFALMLPAIAVLLGPRFELDRLAQAALTIGAMVLGVLVPRLGYGATPPSPELLSDRTLLLGMPMLTVAAARSLVKQPIYGARLTLAATLVALTAAGRADTGPVYPACAAICVALALAALRVSDTTRPGLDRLGGRHAVAIVFGATLAAGLAAGASVVLPRVQNAIVARIMQRLAGNQTGLSNQMSMTSLSGMLESTQVVMRVRGEAPPLLRAYVLTDYEQGYWTAPSKAPPPEIVETPLEPASREGLVELELAGRPLSYFTTPDARDIVVSEGIFEYDAFGLARPAGNLRAKRVWFGRGGAPHNLSPNLDDLRLPPRVRQRLTATLASWGALDGTPAERLTVIEQHLRDEYRYSLSFERTRGQDPVVDFIEKNKEGHCEYFSAAFVLLARAANVPARVVTGYRVTETSPFGYRIVRERNAHAWAEAYVGDAWTTFDPTPPSDLAAAAPTTPWLSALVDGISTGWEAIDDWLGRRTAFELSLLLVALFAVLILGRTLRDRLRKGPALGPPLDDPLPSFSALARALAARGLERDPSETLARFADRLDHADSLEADAREAVACAVRAYARLRYASDGDERAVAASLRAATASVGGRATSSASRT